MKQQNGLPGRIRKFGVMGVFLLAGNVYGRAQAVAPAAAQPADAMTAAVRELQEEVRELRNAVVELRSEAGVPSRDGAAAAELKGHEFERVAGCVRRWRATASEAPNPTGGRPSPDHLKTALPVGNPRSC